MIGVVADHPAAASPRVVSGMAGHPQLLQIPAAATRSTARASQIHGICGASIPTASTRTTSSSSLRARVPTQATAGVARLACAGPTTAGGCGWRAHGSAPL
jgi:hypothetical protein